MGSSSGKVGDLGFNPTHCQSCDRPFLPVTPKKAFHIDACANCSAFWKSVHEQNEKLILKYNVTEYGPLHWDTEPGGFDPTTTFVGPSYSMVTPTVAFVLRRCGDAASVTTGRFFSPIAQGHSGAMRHELAIPRTNPMDRQAILIVPAGVRVFKGVCRPYDGYTGGGVQYYIPYRILLPLWEINQRFFDKGLDVTPAVIAKLQRATQQEIINTVQTQYYREFREARSLRIKQYNHQLECQQLYNDCQNLDRELRDKLSETCSVAKLALLWLRVQQLRQSYLILSRPDFKMDSKVQLNLEDSANLVHTLTKLLKTMLLKDGRTSDADMIREVKYVLWNSRSDNPFKPNALKGKPSIVHDVFSTERQSVQHQSFSSSAGVYDGHSYVVHDDEDVRVIVTLKFSHTERVGEKLWIHWYVASILVIKKS